jgi:hypothetical protein
MTSRTQQTVPVLIALALALGGCATVEPWQRGTLASGRMQLDVDADETAMIGSRRRSREEGIVGASGAGGGSGASGGGCGCH